MSALTWLRRICVGRQALASLEPLLPAALQLEPNNWQQTRHRRSVSRFPPYRRLPEAMIRKLVPDTKLDIRYYMGELNRTRSLLELYHLVNKARSWQRPVVTTAALMKLSALATTASQTDNTVLLRTRAFTRLVNSIDLFLHLYHCHYLCYCIWAFGKLSQTLRPSLFAEEFDTKRQLMNRVLRIVLDHDAKEMKHYHRPHTWVLLIHGLSVLQYDQKDNWLIVLKNVLPVLSELTPVELKVLYESLTEVNKVLNLDECSNTIKEVVSTIQKAHKTEVDAVQEVFVPNPLVVSTQNVSFSLVPPEDCSAPKKLEWWER